MLAQLDDWAGRGWQEAETRAALAKAERDFNRQVQLNEKGRVSAGAFQNLKYDPHNQRAASDIAQLKLSATTAHAAPFAGVVAQRHVKLGKELAVGAPIFRVTDPTPLKASVFVPERELARLKPGQGATPPLMPSPAAAFPPTRKLASPMVDAATATFKVPLQVDDPKGDLKPACLHASASCSNAAPTP